MSRGKWALMALLIAIAAAAIGYRVFQDEPTTSAMAGTEVGEETSNEDFFDRLKNEEASLLNRQGVPSVTRHDRSLKVLPTSGAPLEFTDCFDCGPEGDVEHYLIARLEPLQAALIYRQYYEGDDEVLVTADGFKHELPSWPVFSDDSKAFVVVSPAEAFNWNGVQVWEKSGAHFVKKFEYEPAGYEVYSFKRWQGPNRIELEFSSRDGKGQERCLEAVLVKTTGKWRLEKSKRGTKAFCSPDRPWLPPFLRE